MSVLMDGEMISTALDSLSSQILARHPDPAEIILAGIQRRGADIAERIAARLSRKAARPLLGTIDINLYRDDWTTLAKGAPEVRGSHMPVSPDGRTVILVDDVLFSGRTVRAAMEAILDYGRPDRIELLVLVDRGHRELPVCADFTGCAFLTGRDQHVDVLLEERDGRDAVLLR